MYKKYAGIKFFKLIKGNVHYKQKDVDIDLGKERSMSTITPR